MQPAAGAMAEAFHSVALNDALMPVISNVDAQPHRKAIEIRRRLVRQVSEPVIWTRCVATLLQAGCDRFLECGPGKVLSGLMKRIDKSVACSPLEAIDTLQSVSGESL
jgi:[acyl-carrier-protein] S-malonyltransferase